MKIEKTSKQSFRYTSMNKPFTKLFYLILFFLFSSPACYATGISMPAMSGITDVFYIAAWTVLLIVLMLNYIVYKKTKKKLVWLLTPPMMLILYFLLSMNAIDPFIFYILFSLPILLALMITYLLYEKTKKKLIWLLFPVISLTICLIGLTLYFLPALLEQYG